MAPDLLKEDWLSAEPDKIGLDYAIANAVPAHLEEVRRRVTERVDKTAAAVRDRLTTEIAYWDHRAETLKEQELAGKQPSMNSAKARQRAEELEGRLRHRLGELDAERQLSPLPPVVVGATFVLPAGLVARLRGERDQPAEQYAKDTARVERLAVDAVLAAERSLGREPNEMPHNNPGFDIRSKDPATRRILFIEVKGRVAGAPTVTVSRNEILTGLNKADDFALALVEVDQADGTDVRYLFRPFTGTDEAYFDVTSVNYTWAKLRGRGRPPS